MSTMRAAVLTNFLEVAKSFGINVAAHMRSAGLSMSVLHTPDALISTDAVVRLLEESAQVSQCETFGLRLSLPRSMSGFGVVGLLLAQQQTMRDAWNIILRYLPLINESLALHLEESNDEALLMEEVLTERAQSKRQTVELALAVNLKLFRTLLGSQWTPRRVYFRHQAPHSLRLHQQIFRCPCVFNADINGMSFSRADLDAKNPNADIVMERYAARLVESIPMNGCGTTTARVRHFIHVFLPLQRASIKVVAQSLECSVRTLQLALADEHTEFKRLLNDIRQELAQEYLANPRFNISQVASLLGYTQPNSFTRWYTQQFGASPRNGRTNRGQSTIN